MFQFLASFGVKFRFLTVRLMSAGTLNLVRYFCTTAVHSGIAASGGKFSSWSKFHSVKTCITTQVQPCILITIPIKVWLSYTDKRVV